MFYLTLILPLIAATYLFVFHRTKVVMWEYCLLFGMSIVSYFITSMLMYRSNVSDTEYWGTVGTEVRHYERWNEYIHQTCSYTTCTGSGKDQSCTTHYYDCSYVKDHPEEWKIVNQFGTEYGIDKPTFDYLVKKWSARPQFIEMDRDYHSIDGDAYGFVWDQRTISAQAITTQHSYENKTQTANTLFKFRDMDQKEAKKLGLHEYPEDMLFQKTILGATIPDSTASKYDYVNGIYGPSKQVRVYILYFWGKPRDIAFEQKSYWKGGNKNELVICVGVDKTTKRVTWVEPFSWCKVPMVEARIRSYHATNPEFDLDKFQPELTKYIAADWQRRNFKDFDYISIELSKTQVLIIWIVLSCLCIAVSVWVVKNEIE